MDHRTFISPSGRAWTATTIELPRMLPTEPVQHILRFTSGDLALDLEHWPADWSTLGDDALVHLVRQARPPHLGLPGNRALQRQH